MRHLLLAVLTLSGASAAAQVATSPAPPAPAAQTAPAPTASAFPDGTARNADYVLGPGDALKITVFDEPGLTNTFTIDSDGGFAYQLLERVEAGNKTTAQVRNDILRRLSDGFVKNPQVVVEIASFRPRSISVLGEIRSPGKLTMTGQMSLLDALAQAGWVTAAVGDEIRILHAPDGRGGPTETVVSLNALQNGRPGTNIVMRDGDSVILAKEQKFTMSGQVRQPSQYTWEKGITVRVAIALAGGMSDRGSTRGIRVFREDEKGQKKWFNIGMDDLVQPGDIIDVRQRRL